MDGLHGGGRVGPQTQVQGAQEAQRAAPPEGTWAKFKAGVASIGRAIVNFFKGLGGAGETPLTGRTATTNPEKRSISGGELSRAMGPMKAAILSDSNVKKLASPDPEVRSQALGVLFRGSKDPGAIGAKELTKPLMAPLAQGATEKLMDVIMQHAPKGSKDAPNLEIDPEKPGGPKNDTELRERKQILSEAYNAFLDHALGELGIDRNDPKAPLPFPDSVCALLKEQVDTVLGTMTHASPEEKLAVRNKIIANAILTGLTPGLTNKGAELKEGAPNMSRALMMLGVVAQCQFNEVAPQKGAMSTLTDLYTGNKDRVTGFFDSVPTRGGALLSSMSQYPTAPVTSGVVSDDWETGLQKVEDARPSPFGNMEFPDFVTDTAHFERTDAKAKARFADEATQYLKLALDFSKKPTVDGARELLNTYLRTGSSKEVNIDDGQRESAIATLEKFVENGPGSMTEQDIFALQAVANTVAGLVRTNRFHV